MSGKVYIASMNMRGKWAERPDNVLLLNVTSAQGKDNINRRDFSPMSETYYKDFWCFENYWQSGKVIENVDREKQLVWWKKQTEGKRRYPGSKDKKVLYSEFEGIKRDYITSRKEIYVPEYYELINKTESLKKWKEIVQSGKNVVVYDFDGPRLENGDPTFLEVNIELLKDKINNVSFPFGHGYIVAGTLLNINPELYIK